MLGDFSGREAQLNLFDESSPRVGSEALMELLGRINLEGKANYSSQVKALNQYLK